jgi:hypothetical protein
MNEETAIELEEAGFPIMTRWEVENNQRRSITVSGKGTYPSLSAILQDIFVADNYDAEIGLLGRVGNKGKGYFTAFSGDHLGYWDESKSGDTPEEAMAKLWIALNKKNDNTTT